MSHSTTNLMIAAALKEYYERPKSLDDLLKSKRTQLDAQRAAQSNAKQILETQNECVHSN